MLPLCPALGWIRTSLPCCLSKGSRYCRSMISYIRFWSSKGSENHQFPEVWGKANVAAGPEPDERRLLQGLYLSHKLNIHLFSCRNVSVYDCMIKCFHPWWGVPYIRYYFPKLRKNSETCDISGWGLRIGGCKTCFIMPFGRGEFRRCWVNGPGSPVCYDVKSVTQVMHCRAKFKCSSLNS